MEPNSMVHGEVSESEHRSNPALSNFDWHLNESMRKSASSESLVDALKHPAPALPKISAVQYTNITGPHSGQLERAFENLNTSYRRTVGGLVLKAASRQSELATIMKAVDNLSTATDAKVAKANKADYTGLSTAIAELSSALDSVLAQVDDLLDHLHGIDCALPASDRLLAPHLPHRAHYALLHRALTERSAVHDPCTIVPGTPAITTFSPKAALGSLAHQPSSADLGENIVTLRKQLRAQLHGAP